MRQRSTSPIFFARHSPASKAQDISRLLDPAYSSAAFATNSAYVDRHGELHDPDYRHFPVASRQIPPRPRWETFHDDDSEDDHPDDYHFSPRSSYHHKRPVYSYSYVPAIVVPSSYDSQDTVIDVLDDDDDAFPTPRPSGVSRIISRTRELTRKRRSLDATSDSSPYSSPTLLTPDTPTTPDDEHDTASLHAPSHHHPLSHTLSHQSYHSIPVSPIRRRRYSDIDTEPSQYIPTQEAEREQAWTPTCAQALRRQWQAVSLRIRFSVFRAQRRMKSRLAML